MWDLNKSGSSKFERRTRDHSRSIHALSYSPILGYYCVTGSADGDLRVWDMRDLTKSIMWIRHPASVRAVVFSPIQWQPLQAITALDNGSIYRWDLKVGQRGQLDRIPAAHSGPILALDWSPPSSSSAPLSSGVARQGARSNWYSGSNSALGLLDDIMPGPGNPSDSSVNDMEGTGTGWLASGGLDRCVKVWDLTAPQTRVHISHHPVYTLRTSFPVRKVLWRPGYECELAVVSNAEFGSGTSSNSDSHGPAVNLSPIPGIPPGTGLLSALSSPRMASATLQLADMGGHAEFRTPTPPRNGRSDPVEIWDVRRGYIAKWVVNDSSMEGGVTDIAFADSHAIWTQHSSGTFSQLDLRQTSKPLDAVPRVAVSWDAAGSLTFVTDHPRRWEAPYDDLKLERGRGLNDVQIPIKGLGDSSYVPDSQSVGTVASEDCGDNLEAFAKLAQTYIYEGAERTEICEHNAKMSMDAGSIEATQTWLMLRNLLTDLVPETPPIFPSLTRLMSSPPLSHSVSAPAAIPTVHEVTEIIPHAARSLSYDVDSLMKMKDRSPGSLSKGSDEHPGLNHSPQRITPASSTTSSPRRSTSSLSQPTARLARRESNVGFLPPMRQRLSSSYRRTSFTTPSIKSAYSDSPSDSIRSQISYKHTGEGALSDSDSSEGEDPDISIEITKSDSEGEEASRSSSLTSYPPSRNNNNTAHPSPLSQEVGQQSWTEDERDDEDSPSPASTSESESSDDASQMRALSRPVKRPSMRSRTRSRSSTVASLAVTSSHRNLVRQLSSSSIRTVTAVNVPSTDCDDQGHQKDDGVHGFRECSQSRRPALRHQRMGSAALSGEFFLDSDNHASKNAAASLQSIMMDDEIEKTFREAEKRFRELGWEALIEAFESFIEQV
ncbi:uncharacterized protein FIBRA_00560 [Fibroporia radiculosa]|uniref:Uncharacterized protein n=1 Tax=Fibroporia radiculosa TaxID=599839 RepID=J4GI28_9APHY|nr:uncharacterized protein FIBRA_00560 [Fibroporia radiculosa]CCL98560.1 predicted protein [Fibroporia radiculosa]